jgi:hypothetical protein
LAEETQRMKTEFERYRRQHETQIHDLNYEHRKNTIILTEELRKLKTLVAIMTEFKAIPYKNG